MSLYNLIHFAEPWYRYIIFCNNQDHMFFVRSIKEILNISKTYDVMKKLAVCLNSVGLPKTTKNCIKKVAE